jgi:hypothetical protein
MVVTDPISVHAQGAEGVAKNERPVIYTAGPSPTNETELGPVLEKIYERFYNVADFVDPTSLHDDGEESPVNVDSDKFWQTSGEFDERRWKREHARKTDDSFILDVIRGDFDDAFGFDGYVERFLDVAVNSVDELIEIDPLLFDLDLDFNPALPTPFFDVEFDPVDINLFGGILEFVKQVIFQSLGQVADAVLVARKEGHNMVGASMEVKEAHEQGLPVAVYDHSDADSDNPLPVMLDQHADYVSNNPQWATSWLIDEVQSRKNSEPD